MRGPFRRTRDGKYKVVLGERERTSLATLPDQLRGILSDPGDAALARLFPSAVPDDLIADAEFTMRTQGDLTDARLADIDTFERTIASERLTEDELAAWMRVLNDVRLVLGVRLEISEDDELPIDEDDPRGPSLELYRFLTWLVGAAVEELPV
ncbi:MAG: DUF2017 family protein [Actinomycetota bacterium]